MARYGPNHMWLRRLITHPDYRRRGAAFLLVKWGLEQAAGKGVAIRLRSSPMGRAVCETFGFRFLAEYQTQVEGEEEECCKFGCMAWEEGWSKDALELQRVRSIERLVVRSRCKRRKLWLKDSLVQIDMAESKVIW